MIFDYHLNSMNRVKFSPKDENKIKDKTPLSINFVISLNFTK